MYFGRGSAAHVAVDADRRRSRQALAVAVNTGAAVAHNVAAVEAGAAERATEAAWLEKTAVDRERAAAAAAAGETEDHFVAVASSAGAGAGAVAEGIASAFGLVARAAGIVDVVAGAAAADAVEQARTCTQQQSPRYRRLLPSVLNRLAGLPIAAEEKRPYPETGGGSAAILSRRMAAVY